jgi:hypothetical protein
MVRHLVVRPNNDVSTSTTSTTTSTTVWTHRLLPLILTLVPAILLSTIVPNGSVVMDSEYLENANILLSLGRVALVAVVVKMALLMIRFLFGSNKASSSSSAATQASQQQEQQPVLILSVFAAGVQLSKSTCTLSPSIFTENGAVVSLSSEAPSSSSIPLYFLPRTDIVDCIVQEVIWSYKVTSVLFFRVVVTTTGTEQQQQQTLRLVEVFPGVELLYMECLMLRGEILQALGIQ